MALTQNERNKRYMSKVRVESRAFRNLRVFATACRDDEMTRLVEAAYGGRLPRDA